MVPGHMLVTMRRSKSDIDGGEGRNNNEQELHLWGTEKTDFREREEGLYIQKVEKNEKVADVRRLEVRERRKFV